jgi:hypothetical protein
MAEFPFSWRVVVAAAACVGTSRRLGSYLLDFSGGRRLDGSAVVSEWIAGMRRHQTTLG